MLETAERLVDRGEGARGPAVPAARRRPARDGRRGSTPPSQVLDSYLLRSLAVAGYAPSFDHCAAAARGPAPLLHPSAGGVLCALPARPARPPRRRRPSALLAALLTGDWAVRRRDRAAPPPRGQRPRRRLPRVAPRARPALAGVRRTLTRAALTTRRVGANAPPSAAPAIRRVGALGCAREATPSARRPRTRAARAARRTRRSRAEARRDRDGRQRPLGQGARAAPHGGARAGRGGAASTSSRARSRSA